MLTPSEIESLQRDKRESGAWLMAEMRKTRLAREAIEELKAGQIGQVSVITDGGRMIYMPTLEEDAVITAAAESDPDARPLTEAEWAAVRPRRGRPPASATKTRITIRLDAATVRAYRRHAASVGTNYQTLINQVLTQHVAELSSQDSP